MCLKAQELAFRFDRAMPINSDSQNSCFQKKRYYSSWLRLWCGLWLSTFYQVQPKPLSLVFKVLQPASYPSLLTASMHPYCNHSMLPEQFFTTMPLTKSLSLHCRSPQSLPDTSSILGHRGWIPQVEVISPSSLKASMTPSSSLIFWCIHIFSPPWTLRSLRHRTRLYAAWYVRHLPQCNHTSATMGMEGRAPYSATCMTPSTSASLKVMPSAPGSPPFVPATTTHGTPACQAPTSPDFCGIGGIIPILQMKKPWRRD